MDRKIPQHEIRRVRRRRIILTTAVVATVAVAGCIMASLARTSVKRTDLELAAVGRGSLEIMLSASGKVVPAYEQIVNSPIDTRIVEVYRHAGDAVEAGAPLLALDIISAQTEYDQMSDRCNMLRCQVEQMRLANSTYITDLEMRVKVKEMAVNRQAVDLRNEHYLDSLGSGTGDNVHRARLAYNTGCLELEQLRKQLDNERRVKDADLQVKRLELQVADKSLAELHRVLDEARVQAPCSGVLTYISNNIGERQPKGVHIATVSDLSHFKVDCQIADGYGGSLRHGGRTKVRVGRRIMLDGVITNITPLSQGGVMTFSVQLANDSASVLRSGLKTDVFVVDDVVDEALLLKKGSYYTGPGEYDMFVLDADGGSLTRRTVRLGASGYDSVEVVDGLAEGDLVVVTDMNRVRNSSHIPISD